MKPTTPSPSIYEPPFARTSQRRHLTAPSSPQHPSQSREAADTTPRGWHARTANDSNFTLKSPPSSSIYTPKTVQPRLPAQGGPRCRQQHLHQQVNRGDNICFVICIQYSQNLIRLLSVSSTKPTRRGQSTETGKVFDQYPCGSSRHPAPLHGQISAKISVKQCRPRRQQHIGGTNEQQFSRPSSYAIQSQRAGK